MTFVDIDRIRVKGSPASAFIDRNARRVFVTPWEHLTAYTASSTDALQILRIPKPPRRYKCSIGCVTSQTLHAQNDSGIRVWLVDARKTPLVLAQIPSHSDAIICGWSNADRDPTFAGLMVSARISEKFFPDGLLLTRDVEPAFLIQFLGSTVEASSSVWYRFEEWT